MEGKIEFGCEYNADNIYAQADANNSVASIAGKFAGNGITKGWIQLGQQCKLACI
jgi:hypothetical protein